MSFPRYGSYKDSGVEWLGDVPSDWSVKRLRFVADINPSKREVSDVPADFEVSFLPMEAIGDDGTVNLMGRRMLSEVQSGYTFFRDGDVVFAKITPCFENGKGALLQGLLGGIGFGTTELIVIRAKFEECLAEFLHWLFVSPSFRKRGEATMYGAGGQKRVPDEFVRNFETALPPLDEQHAIAAFLDRETAKIDSLIEEQKRLIALLKEKRQAVISHAVTKGLNPNAPMKDSGVEWLGEVPEHWEVVQLRHICSLLRDGTHLPPPRVDDGVPLLSVRNIVNGSFGFKDDDSMISTQDHDAMSRSFVPQAGDVLLAIVGATLGKSALVPMDMGPFHIQRSLAIFRTKKFVAPAFINYVFQSNGFQNILWQSVGFSAQPGIYLGTLAGFFVPRVSLDEQHKITFYLDAVTSELSKLIDEAETAISLLQERRSALISAAVTGKIDVRGLVPAHEAAA